MSLLVAARLVAWFVSHHIDHDATRAERRRARGDESRSDEEVMLSARFVLHILVRWTLLRQGLPRRRPTQIPILIGIADEPFTLVAFERVLLFLLLVMLPFHTAS